MRKNKTVAFASIILKFATVAALILALRNTLLSSPTAGANTSKNIDFHRHNGL